jgi:hypothetical protein
MTGSFLPRSVGAALLLLGALAADLAAQTRPAGWSSGTGAFYETYDFLDPEVVGIRSVSLASVPFAVRGPVAGGVGVEVRGAFARAGLVRDDGSEVTLSGLTDTELRVSFGAWRDQVVLSAGVLLPTGSPTLTFEEAELAGLVAAELLPFRISSWGAGGGLGMVTSFAVPVGGFGIGLSAGYTAGREFEPLADGQLAYRPGDEIRLRLAVDRTIGSAAKASLLLGTQQYREDRFAGESVFQPGNRFEALASLAFAAGDVSTAVVYGGLQHRGAGRLTVTGFDTPAQDLITTGGAVRIPQGAATLVPSLDVRLFRRADGFGQGHLTALGAALEWPAGAVTIVPTLRGRFGSAVLWEDEDTAVRGLEAGLGLRLRL